jgi:outer membrane protein assembly factor BamB
MTTPVRPAVSPDWAADVTLEPQGTAPVGTNDAIVPPSGYADNGWPLGIKPIRQYDNGIKRIHGDWINFLNATSVHWFDTMREALLYYAGIVGNRYEIIPNRPNLFVVNNSAAPMTDVGAGGALDVTPTLTATARAVTSDGFAFYVGAGTFVASLNIDGSQNWRINVGYQVHSLCLRHPAKIVVGCATGIIVDLDSETGALASVASVGTSDPVTSLASDGRLLVALCGTKAIIYNVGNTPSQVTVNNAVAATISGRKMYVAVADAGTPFYGVKVYDDTAALLFDYPLPSLSSTPSPTSITADGQFVVVTHDDDDNGNNVTILSGGTRFAAPTGTVWAQSTPYTPNCCAIDDSAVYVGSATATVTAFDKRTGARLWENDATGTLVSLFADCYAIYGAGMNGANAQYLGWNPGYSSRTFQLVDPVLGAVIPQALHAIPVR